MNEIEIRRIDAAHAADVRLPNEPFEIFGRMIPSYVDECWAYRIERFPEVRTMCFPDEDYDFEALSKNSVCIGAYDAGKCIGLAILQQAWFKYMYLYDLKVNRAYRGSGVAAKLMEEAKRVSLENGYAGIYTQVQDNNLAAAMFYLKQGFEIDGLDCRVYRGTRQEDKKDILMYMDIHS